MESVTARTFALAATIFAGNGLIRSVAYIAAGLEADSLECRSRWMEVCRCFLTAAFLFLCSPSRRLLEISLRTLSIKLQCAKARSCVQITLSIGIYRIGHDFTSCNIFFFWACELSATISHDISLIFADQYTEPLPTSQHLLIHLSILARCGSLICSDFLLDMINHRDRF